MTAPSGYRDTWLSGVDGNDQGAPADEYGSERTAETQLPGMFLFAAKSP